MGRVTKPGAAVAKAHFGMSKLNLLLVALMMASCGSLGFWLGIHRHLSCPTVSNGALSKVHVAHAAHANSQRVAWGGKQGLSGLKPTEAQEEKAGLPFMDAKKQGQSPLETDWDKDVDLEGYIKAGLPEEEAKRAILYEQRFGKLRREDGMYQMDYEVVASQKETHPQAPFWIAANRPKGPFGSPPDKNPKKDPILYAFVLTFPKRHDPKAVAVNQTWGARFDHLVFMSTETYPTLNMAVLPIKNESRAMLWPKTKLAWRYTYDHYIDKADWFMKADDDTFVMVDNLREFLSQYDPDVPHFFGKRFLLHRGTPRLEHSYYSGGSGYVLSRGALRLLGQNASYAFDTHGTAEDVEMAKAMKRLGIECEDTRDQFGRERFIPLNINHLRYKYSHVVKPKFWYWRYSYYPTGELQECCSRRWISTHYIYSMDLYRLERDYVAGKEGCGNEPPPKAPIWGIPRKKNS